MITIDKDKDENQPLNKKARSLADIAKWGKITAVFLIITGSLSALSAIVTLLGAIPGGSAHHFRRHADALGKSGRRPSGRTRRKRGRKYACTLRVIYQNAVFFTRHPVWYWAFSLLF